MALLRFTSPAVLYREISCGADVLPAEIVLRLEDVRDYLKGRRDQLAEAGYAHPPTVAPEHRRFDFEIRQHRNFLEWSRKVGELEEAMASDRDVVWDGQEPALRLYKIPIFQGRYVQVTCPACERVYRPEGCTVESWSRVSGPRAGVGGKVLLCPRRHILFSWEMWVS